jgi:hypothetical protein
MGVAADLVLELAELEKVGHDDESTVELHGGAVLCVDAHNALADAPRGDRGARRDRL